jgi:hypothetical protein
MSSYCEYKLLSLKVGQDNWSNEEIMIGGIKSFSRGWMACRSS